MLESVEAIYVRQSKDKKDSLSIEGQIERCRFECGCPETAIIYEDRGFSGKNMQRPGFQRMLRDVKEGKINKIIVYRLDRLSRSIIDFGQLWTELELHQVDFVSVNEKFDTSTPVGRAMIYIIMVFAQLERETIAERVTDNYYTRIKHGNWPGGPAPVGLANLKIKNGEGKLVPSLGYTKEFDVVKEIFYRYALEDVSLGEIGKNLTERKIPCRKRKGWDNVALSRILHSPVYVQADANIYRYYQSRGVEKFSNTIEEFDGSCSAHVVGKRTGNVRKYNDLTEHIVSLTNFQGRIPSDIWIMCQQKLEKNSQIGNAGKGKYTWLTGLLKCGECGYSLTVKKWKENRYLCCSGRGNLHICSKRTFLITVDEIENEVQKELEMVLDECNQEQTRVSDKNTRQRLRQEKEQIDEIIQRLMERMREASDVSMKYINSELEMLDLRKAELQKEAKIYEKDRMSYFPEIIFNQLCFEEKKMTAQAFIERIKVSDDEIEIIWKI